MKNAVEVVLSDVNNGDQILGQHNIDEIIANAAPGNKTKISTYDGTYKIEFKEKKGELISVVKNVYGLFKEGISFDIVQRKAEILIAICAYFDDPKYIMYYHEDVPSIQKFKIAQKANVKV